MAQYTQIQLQTIRSAIGYSKNFLQFEPFIDSAIKSTLSQADGGPNVDTTIQDRVNYIAQQILRLEGNIILMEGMSFISPNKDGIDPYRGIKISEIRSRKWIKQLIILLGLSDVKTDYLGSPDTNNNPMERSMFTFPDEI